MKNRKPIHDNWETPEYLLEYIQEKYFDGKKFYDPCPLDYKKDTLKDDWLSPCYVNPPYSRKLKELFIVKSYHEWYVKKCHIVMLLPVSTSTKIFHEYIYPNCNIEFLRGRVKFKGWNSIGEYVTKKCGQHDSMLCEFKP